MMPSAMYDVDTGRRVLSTDRGLRTDKGQIPRRLVVSMVECSPNKKPWRYEVCLMSFDGGRDPIWPIFATITLIDAVAIARKLRNVAATLPTDTDLDAAGALLLAWAAALGWTRHDHAVWLDDRVKRTPLFTTVPAVPRSL